MTTVAYLGGAWATNIGNAFYNVGILHLLRTVLDPGDVYFVPNLARWYWTSSNTYDPVLDVDADVFLLSGPCLSEDLEMFRPLFARLGAEGRQVAFISAGAGRYTDHEQEQVAQILKAYPSVVRFVATRDHETFEMYRDRLSCPVYDGICGSMFLDEAVNVPRLTRPPYVVLSVEAEHEPTLRHVAGNLQIIETCTEGRRRDRRRPRWFGPARTRSRPEPVSVVGPFDIVRTQHRAFTRDADVLFPSPATHYAVIPEGYLAIYKSAELVISNRVHACAAALVLGSAARYLDTSPRARDGRWFLLDRVGAGAVRERPTRLDRDLLVRERGGLESFVRANL